MLLLAERGISMKRKHYTLMALRMVGLPALVVAIVGALSLPAAADSTVKIDLWEKADASQGMTLSTSEVKAGKVTFDITNTSKAMEHEFIMVKTDMTVDQFPMNDTRTRIDEAKLEGMDEFGDLEAGATKSWTRDLTPGRYVLFCNLRGHFPAGMHATLTVTP